MIRIFLFGATGNLSLKKLYPSFYELIEKEMVVDEIEIIGISRRPYDNGMFHNFLIENIGGIRDVKKWLGFINKLKYRQVAFDNLSDYQGLEASTNILEKDTNIFYLATAPQFFKTVVKNLEASGLLLKGNLNYRIVFEKPFGKDLESATEINAYLNNFVVEDQIYRMDHYLGKEMIQNIMTLRFSNMLFESSLNRDFVDHIQITVSESVGVAERAGYYDHAGAIRDMIQSHLMQMLTLVTMDNPESFDYKSLVESKATVLESLFIENVSEDLVIGQYKASENMKGYREEVDVPEKSCTETFAALKIKSKLPRWQGVDFYLRSGKRMSEKLSEIVVVYKEPNGIVMKACPTNIMVIEIYPTEGMSLKFNMKKPGITKELITREMEFCQSCDIDYSVREAYESLIYDVIIGKHDLYTKWDEVKLEWTFIEKILHNCEDLVEKLDFYPAGSTGPLKSLELIERDHRKWYSL